MSRIDECAGVHQGDSMNGEEIFVIGLLIASVVGVTIMAIKSRR
jgi:hypothetical protein